MRTLNDSRRFNAKMTSRVPAWKRLGLRLKNASGDVQQSSTPTVNGHVEDADSKLIDPAIAKDSTSKTSKRPRDDGDLAKKPKKKKLNGTVANHVSSETSPSSPDPHPAVAQRESKKRSKSRSKGDDDAHDPSRRYVAPFHPSAGSRTLGGDSDCVTKDRKSGCSGHASDVPDSADHSS